MSELLYIVGGAWLGQQAAATLCRMGAPYPLGCSKCLTFWTMLLAFAATGHGLLSIPMAAVSSLIAYYLDLHTL